MTGPDVMTIGETMVALRSQTMPSTGSTVSTSIAGAESNVAIALARLGHHASWVGRVGQDAMGDLVLRTLRAEGVHVSGARSDAASTGVVFFERRLPTMQRGSYMRTGSAATQLCPADVDVPPGTRIVHVTGVTAALVPTPVRPCSPPSSRRVTKALWSASTSTSAAGSGTPKTPGRS